jgi:hypothetical protein
MAIVRDSLPMPIAMGVEVIGSQGGHEPRTDEHVELAERSRRAFRIVTLASNTGQRLDVVKMRWSDLRSTTGAWHQRIRRKPVPGAGHEGARRGARDPGAAPGFIAPARPASPDPQGADLA